MKAKRKFLALLLALAMVCSMVLPAFAAPAATPPETPDASAAEDGSAEGEDGAADAELEGKIVILHTNDVHGGIEGYAKVAALKAEYEAAGADVLLLDAGDFIQGETSVSVSEGATAIELMNMVGYDVAAPGNHEFDFGYANLKKLEEAADFPILAANIKFEGETAFGDHIVLTAGETKIGVFGLDTPETATKAHPAKIQGVTFVGSEDMYALAQAEVKVLQDEGCDYIICLGHLGIDQESAAEGNRSIDLLNSVTGIDIFIDGHSHSTLEAVKEATGGTGKVGDTWLTSTGTKLANVGRIILDGETITVESIDVSEYEGDETIAARAKEIRGEIEAEYGATFATSEVDLNGERDPGNRTEETNLGDLITDAMVWFATKDGGLEVDNDHVVGITNGGGIRAAINKGGITKNDVNTVLPFGNTVAVIYVTGEDLLEVLEASTYCTPTAVGGFPQVAGIEFTVDAAKDFDQGELYPDTTYHAPASIQRVTIDSINGNEFSLTDTYAIISNDFCAAGGDTYYAFTVAASVVDTGTALDEALMQFITEELGGVIGEEYAEPAGRITVVLPDVVEPETPEPEPIPEPQPEGAYTIVRGDNLSKIAKAHYGDTSKWRVIYEANKDVIKNPNQIWPGQVIVIPAA